MPVLTNFDVNQQTYRMKTICYLLYQLTKVRSSAGKTAGKGLTGRLNSPAIAATTATWPRRARLNDERKQIQRRQRQPQSKCAQNLVGAIAAEEVSGFELRDIHSNMQRPGNVPAARRSAAHGLRAPADESYRSRYIRRSVVVRWFARCSISAKFIGATRYTT